MGTLQISAGEGETEVSGAHEALAQIVEATAPGEKYARFHESWVRGLNTQRLDAEPKYAHSALSHSSVMFQVLPVTTGHLSIMYTFDVEPGMGTLPVLIPTSDVHPVSFVHHVYPMSFPHHVHHV